MVAENDVGEETYSRPPAGEDIKKICRSLNENGVEYVLVGGLAMNFHGLARMTHDIDLLIDTSPENVSKVIDALSVLPDKAVRGVGLDDIQKYTVVRIADEVVIDLIGKIGDVTTKNAKIQEFQAEGVKVPVADIETMIKTKQGYRGKDKEDLAYLRMKKAERKK
ncbi:MAG: hypothetical protein C4589_06535 [Peptococcaceae bacterium]|nr:MAG: hypothetical protein C4589_06535 [Peptococcaceae bacterium]